MIESQYKILAASSIPLTEMVVSSGNGEARAVIAHRLTIHGNGRFVHGKERVVMGLSTGLGKDGMSSEQNAFIVARELTKLYPLGGSEVVGIRDVDLEVQPGDLVVLRGNSGSGKSTLLALLAGLDQPTRGRLTVGGQDMGAASLDALTHYRRQTVGMVFQSFNLLPTLNAFENVCLPAFLAGKDRSVTQRRARELLEWLNLSSRASHLPAQLSGGEMQRTAIARALINDPALILADEPTGNLDSQHGQVVIELLRELNQSWRRTVIIATHSHLADQHADLILTLKDGLIVERVRCP
ncbi:MAG: ABC transporter ATP-binding protein [Syntrophobacteraceae bacterium]